MEGRIFMENIKMMYKLFVRLKNKGFKQIYEAAVISESRKSPQETDDKNMGERA